MDLSLCEIIRRPVVTGKAQRLNVNQKCLVLEVHPHANKPLVAQAIEQLFGVKVDSVRIVNRKGKRRRIPGRRTTTVGKTVKRAIVCLAEGHKLDLVEQPDKAVAEGNES